MKKPIIIISGLSGSGKTAIIKKIFQLYADQLNLKFSISYTTRKTRKNEENGIDYHFISENKFLEMIKTNMFLEYVNYANYYYGTSKQVIHEILIRNENILLDVEINGVNNIKKYYGKKTLTIFIDVQDINVLIKRISERKTETLIDLQKRVNIAKKEEICKKDFDYIVINKENELDITINNVYKILKNNLIAR